MITDDHLAQQRLAGQAVNDMFANPNADGPIIVDVASRALEHHPGLRNAIQPRIKPTGPEIDPARNRSLFALDDRWRRRLLDSPEGLVGPFWMTGNCLQPYLSELLTCWFDPSVEPAAGDMVLLHYSDADMERMFADGRQSPAWWREHSGLPIANTLMKQLKFLDGVPYLVAAEGAIRFGGSRVLGVLRFYLEPRDLSPAALNEAWETRRNGVSLSRIQAMLAEAGKTLRP